MNVPGPAASCPASPPGHCSFLRMTCPGVCVFLSILVGAPVGVVLLRALEDRLLYVNPRARHYLRELMIPETADAIRTGLLGGSHSCEKHAEWSTITRGGRAYEYRDCFLDAGQLIFIADATDRKLYERIAVRADMESNTALKRAGFVGGFSLRSVLAL